MDTENNNKNNNENINDNIHKDNNNTNNNYIKKSKKNNLYRILMMFNDIIFECSKNKNFNKKIYF